MFDDDEKVYLLNVPRADNEINIILLYYHRFPKITSITVSHKIILCVFLENLRVRPSTHITHSHAYGVPILCLYNILLRQFGMHDKSVKSLPIRINIIDVLNNYAHRDIRLQNIVKHACIK